MSDDEFLALAGKTPGEIMIDLRDRPNGRFLRIRILPWTEPRLCAGYVDRTPKRAMLLLEKLVWLTLPEV